MAKSSHKFILGQAVGYTPRAGADAPLGLYLVVAKLPERDGEPAYRIKHVNGSVEFTVTESELRWVNA